MTYPSDPTREQPPTYPPQVYRPPYQPPQTVIVNQAPPSSGAATASLVLGILGVLGGWCLFGLPCVAAVVFGHVGLRDTRDGTRSGRGMAVAGLILGYVFVAPMIVFAVMVFFGGLVDTVAPGSTPTP